MSLAEEATLTDATIALAGLAKLAELAELADKSPDAGLLRKIVLFMAQRPMDMHVGSLCGATPQRPWRP